MKNEGVSCHQTRCGSFAERIYVSTCCTMWRSYVHRPDTTRKGLRRQVEYLLDFHSVIEKPAERKEAKYTNVDRRSTKVLQSERNSRDITEFQDSCTTSTASIQRTISLCYWSLSLCTYFTTRLRNKRVRAGHLLFSTSDRSGL